MDDTHYYGATYDLALDRAAVDSEVAEVSEQLLRAVLALDELEEVGRVVDELMFGDEYETSIGKANTHGSPGLATNEDIVRQQTEQEGDVGLQMGTHKFRFVHRQIKLLTFTPRIRNSTRARSIFLLATSYVMPLTVHLTRRLS